MYIPLQVYLYIYNIFTRGRTALPGYYFIPPFPFLHFFQTIFFTPSGGSPHPLHNFIFSSNCHFDLLPPLRSPTLFVIHIIFTYYCHCINNNILFQSTYLLKFQVRSSILFFINNNQFLINILLTFSINF